MVLAAGRLAAQKGIGTLLDAAAGWRDLDPPPLVVIAGDGPLAAGLRARAAALGLDAVFARPGGRRARAARRGGGVRAAQPVGGAAAGAAGGAARGQAGRGTRVGGVPGLTGEDAALLVPPGDAPALAAAVRSVLTDPALAARLRAAAAARAAALPAEADAVTAALSAYACRRRGPGLR